MEPEDSDSGADRMHGSDGPMRGRPIKSIGEISALIGCEFVATVKMPAADTDGRGPSTLRGAKEEEMLSKIKNLKGGWGFLAGVLITMLLVPSVAVAAGLRYNGIEGTSKNKADVTGAGQLLTAPATPTNLFSPATVDLSASYQAVATPPTNSALVIENLDVNVLADAGSGLIFQLMPTNCGGFFTNPVFAPRQSARRGSGHLQHPPGTRTRRSFGRLALCGIDHIEPSGRGEPHG